MSKRLDRGAGILLPISSLPSPYGIGTLGKAAYKFADKLFGNQNSFNPNLQFNTKLDKNNFNTHFQHILTYQNSIVHPNPSLSITSEYLGFFRETKFHRKLINLTIESILNKY